MANDVFLLLHGWGGNKPAHWQEHLNTKLQEAGVTVYYPKMPNPMSPDLAAWQTTLSSTLAEIKAAHPDAPLTILAHSLGGINWMHYAASVGDNPAQVADRILLVAPPYVMAEAPPLDAPPGVPAFFPPPFAPAALKALANETTIIASSNDDYSTYDQTTGLAAKLDLPVQVLQGGGHISPYYGYGEWQWVLDWCLRTAEFPPQPRITE